VSEAARTKPYAAEKWWHRLLRVFGYGLTLLVLALSSVILVEDADYFTYTYSFEPNYETSPGEEFDCHAYESLKSMSCGAFSNGDEFIKYYLSVKGDDKLRTGQRSVNEFFAELRSKGHKDSDLAVSLIGDKGFMYRRQKHWDEKKLLVAILYAVGITLGFFAAMFATYKVILFVVHGHTRVVRESHGAF
jgi:hypothetical protein